MKQSPWIPGNGHEDLRRTADKVLDELIRSHGAEVCRRLAAVDTTPEEKRLLVRELLRGAAERP